MPSRESVRVHFPLFVRLLLWIASGQIAFAAVAASIWLTRLDKLAMHHDRWIVAFVQVFVLYLLPAALAYVGGLAALGFTPQIYKRALEERTNDTWAFAVAILTGGFFGYVLMLIFSDTQLSG